MIKLDKEYMQRPEESILDWKYRLIIGKASKETKLSWDAIAILLGLSCGGEYLRKIAYGIIEYREWSNDKRLESKCEEEVLETIEAIDQIEEVRMANEREKIRISDQKRELRKLLREWARAEKIREDIIGAVKDISDMRPIKIVPRVKTNFEREAALLLSDWHKGVKINNHWNMFTDVEFEKRVKDLIEKTIVYGKEQKIKKLHVFLLGDLINGLIHVTTRIENMEHVVKQTKAVAEILAQVLAKLAEEFEEIIVYSARGNHDRITANKQESITQESFFDFIPWYLEARIGHIKSIKIAENKYDDEIVVTDICGSNIFAVHGHKDKIKNIVSNLSQMIRIFPDYIFTAHGHHLEENEFHQCEVIANSSLSGTDTFAKDIRRTSKAVQRFIVFDRDEGRLCTYNIRLA